MQTQTTWQGILQFEENSTPVIIQIGKLNINSFLHFMDGKRIVLSVELVHDSTSAEQDAGQIRTVGRLEYDPKKKTFLFENYPLVQFLESFVGQRVKVQIEQDRSYLSSRMQ